MNIVGTYCPFRILIVFVLAIDSFFSSSGYHSPLKSEVINFANYNNGDIIWAGTLHSKWNIMIFPGIANEIIFMSPLFFDFPQ